MTSRTKSLLIILLALILSLSFIVGILFFYISNKLPSSEEFTADITKEILTYTKEKELPPQIKDKISIINNQSKSDKERYEALSVLAFYFSNAYTSTHDPEIRKFSSEVLAEYAKRNFPDMYNDSLFNFPCADPTCGEQIDAELNSIISQIESLRMSEVKKAAVIRNLKTAAYVTEKNNKKFGFQLIVDQLSGLGDSSASKSAENIQNYYKNKYKSNL